jgi:hypothetical protein
MGKVDTCDFESFRNSKNTSRFTDKRFQFTRITGGVEYRSNGTKLSSVGRQLANVLSWVSI